MAKQTVSGKAFEYSIAKNYYNYFLKKGLTVLLIHDNPLTIAKNAYASFSALDQKQFDIAAKNTIETLVAVEPGLVSQQNLSDTLKIRLAADSEGKAGDVRDIIFTRDNIKPKWEIGVSAKNNHDAVKHSRLSPTIDFGKEWLGYGCSKNYFNEINTVFDWIKSLMKENPKSTWNNLGVTKPNKVYKPILLAFKKEMHFLASSQIKVPENLLSYLIGRFPFYKIVKDDTNNLVVVKAFNLKGLLNKTVSGVKPKAYTEKINLPSRIIEFEFIENSDNTLMMVLDKGWQISFRIHSARTLLEPSLKFDINLIGNPPILFTQHLFLF